MAIGKNISIPRRGGSDHRQLGTVRCWRTRSRSPFADRARVGAHRRGRGGRRARPLEHPAHPDLHGYYLRLRTALRATRCCASPSARRAAHSAPARPTPPPPPPPGAATCFSWSLLAARHGAHHRRGERGFPRAGRRGWQALHAAPQGAATPALGRRPARRVQGFRPPPPAWWRGSPRTLRRRTLPAKSAGGPALPAKRSHPGRRRRSPPHGGSSPGAVPPRRRPPGPTARPSGSGGPPRERRPAAGRRGHLYQNRPPASIVFDNFPASSSFSPYDRYQTGYWNLDAQEPVSRAGFSPPTWASATASSTSPAFRAMPIDRPLGRRGLGSECRGGHLLAGWLRMLYRGSQLRRPTR